MRGSTAGTLATMSYAVRTPVFEGPFDLLLHLILKQEVELWEPDIRSPCETRTPPSPAPSSTSAEIECDRARTSGAAASGIRLGPG